MLNDIIYNLLNTRYDSLRRDDNGTIQYDNEFAQVIDNILLCKEFHLCDDETYYDYTYRISGATEDRNDNKLYHLKETPSINHRYVGDVVTNDVMKHWLPGDNVFISAGTGRGKNTFIKEQLLSRYRYDNIVIFENRESLLKQQVVEMVEKIDNESVNPKRLENDNGFYFGPTQNILLISYQSAALKLLLNDRRFTSMINNARYLVFDEAHYILDDCMFNKGIAYLVDALLKARIIPSSISGPSLQSSTPYATKIFMSGTMEQFFLFNQEISPIDKKTIVNITEGDKYNDNSYFEFLRLSNANFSRMTHIISMPTDYSYVNPFKFKLYSDLADSVISTMNNEKWLIFVSTIKEGEDLQNLLQEKSEHKSDNQIKFLSASNKNRKENKQLYLDLIQNSKFSCQVLISTTLLYNGVNIKDDKLKNIVVPFTTIPVIKQLIGRKRIKDDETLNVYFQDASYGDVRNKYSECIREYMAVIELQNNRFNHALMSANDLGRENDIRTKYIYYRPYFTVCNSSNQSNLYPTLEVCLNLPAQRKLYFDTCYYIYLLKKLSENGEEEIAETWEQEDSVKIILRHMSISDKPIKEINTLSPEAVKKSVVDTLYDYLCGLCGEDDCRIIKASDENNSVDTIGEIYRMINDTYKALNNNQIIDSHWKDKNRFVPNNKVEDFFKEISIPFMITHSKLNGIMQIEIKKLTEI